MSKANESSEGEQWNLVQRKNNKEKKHIMGLKQLSFSKKPEDLAVKLPPLRVNRPVVLFEIVNTKRQMIKMSIAHIYSCRR